MASNLVAMASNLLAMASTYFIHSIACLMFNKLIDVGHRPRLAVLWARP